MPTDVRMPQMGESIFEGTITKWLKKPGDTVQRDEPLFEISTDKVDAEIPSPAAGVLTEIRAAEGSTVQVNSVVGVIGESGSAVAAAKSSAPAKVEETKAAAAAEQAQITPVSKLAGGPDEPPVPSEAAPEKGGARHDVIMPQMGESIFEGTITKWLKNVGDTVQRDEPLFEISTDKVDAEIPSPAAGVLSEIKVQAGQTAQINTVVGVIGGAAGASSAETKPSAASNGSVPVPTPAAAQVLVSAPAPEPVAAEAEHVRSSPLVRKIARENNVNLAAVPGTGAGGRVTKEDILAYIEKGPVAVATRPAATAAPSKPVAPAAPIPGELMPLSRMRSIIAQRMVESKHTAPHVHTVFKIDFTRIVKLREKEKSKYEQRNGVKLTYMPFIARAVIATLRKMPIVNASLEGDAIRYHANINLGIAVALDWGLIVPVIKEAEEKSFLGIARAIADLAERARGKKLKPDEVGSGTFTITNPGIFGEQFGTPIINQPESAILGVGGLFKEPAVVTTEDGTDSVTIRSFLHLTLGFDHRIIDGADAGKFMAEVKKYLENWSEEIG